MVVSLADGKSELLRALLAPWDSHDLSAFAEKGNHSRGTNMLLFQNACGTFRFKPARRWCHDGFLTSSTAISTRVLEAELESFFSCVIGNNKGASG